MTSKETKELERKKANKDERFKNHKQADKWWHRLRLVQKNRIFMAYFRTKKYGTKKRNISSKKKQ